jgi:Polyketide cyclase / dehydrase and lipid transport
VPGFVTDVRLDGEDRIVTFYNQLVARERLVNTSDADRRLVWSVIDGPFAHYNSAAQVFPAGAGTRFAWISDLLPEEMARHVDEMMERGIDTIKHTLETAAAPFRAG